MDGISDLAKQIYCSRGYLYSSLFVLLSQIASRVLGLAVSSEGLKVILFAPYGMTERLKSRRRGASRATSMDLSSAFHILGAGNMAMIRGQDLGRSAS